MTATQDLAFMKLALREAKKGVGRTSPNPAVGAVVVRNGRVVGKGYHRRAGSPHAEVNALLEAGHLAQGATLYVTLEPCNHAGRTPPCTRAILASGIKRVVVGMRDPNPHVAGGGCDYLASQGLDVTHGLLAPKCEEINRPFVKHVATGLPWVIMKAGASLDGRIATHTGHSGWITNEQSRREVHRLRNRVDAILVGAGTACCDNPSLTTRLPGGHGRDPLRVVLDPGLRLDTGAKMLTQDSSAATLIFCAPGAEKGRKANLTKAGAVIKLAPETGPGRLDLEVVLAELGRTGVTSLLVEGGGRVHGSFLQAGLVNEVYLFLAPRFLGADGVPVVDMPGAPSVGDNPRLHVDRFRRLGDDLLVVGRF